MVARRLRRPERAPYQSIGRVLIERGELLASEASMQGIQAWARANPAKLDELLNSNPSYVFFRELSPRLSPEEGPLGALACRCWRNARSPSTRARSRLRRPGLPGDNPAEQRGALRRLMMAQDTGGAIKGVVRADFFWGFGAEAGAQAGRMKQAGQMWVLCRRGRTKIKRTVLGYGAFCTAMVRTSGFPHGNGAAFAAPHCHLIDFNG